jgi:hypothetical protein
MAIANRPLSVVVGIFFIAYYLALGYVKWYLHGPEMLWEMLWVCNTSIVLSGIFMLIGYMPGVEQMIMVIPSVHATWVLDAASYLLFGVFPIGTAAYLANPHDILETSFTFHHVWFIPLSCLVLYKNGKICAHSWVWGSVNACTFLMLARYSGSPVHLNVNQCYHWSYDLKIPIVHLFDDSHGIFFINYYIFIYCGLMNGAAWVVLRVFSYFALDEAAAPAEKKRNRVINWWNVFMIVIAYDGILLVQNF